MATPFPYIGPGIRTNTTRLFFSKSGQRDYLFSCGHTPCDANRFIGRLVKPSTYLMASQCRRSSRPGNKVTYVPLAGFPSPGIPTTVRCSFGPVSYSPCFVNQCNDLELDWDGSQYSGFSIPLSSGSIPITITPVFIAGNFSTWHFNMIGSCAPGGATTFMNVGLSCYAPMQGGTSAPLGAIPSICCSSAVDPNSSYFCNIFGCTPNRVLGRCIGSKNGMRVYIFGECCAPSICNAGVSCCGCTAVPVAWKFSIAGITNGTLVGCPGGCTGFNGTWTLVYGQPSGSSPCTWGVPSTESGGVCTPGSPWNLSCDANNWILQTQTGGNIVYTAPRSGFRCMGSTSLVPNVMTLFSVGTSCLTPPATINIYSA